jgi:hypothetical protein
MAKRMTPKKIMSPIDITINQEEFLEYGKRLEQDAAQVMRLFAGLGLDDRCTPEGVESFLKKRGL